MKANELRIGNLVKYQESVHNFAGKITTVTEIVFDTVDLYDAIPLTEEWLLKLGFKYREFLNDFFIKLDDHNILIVEKEVIGFTIYKCEENQRKCFLTKRYYAHQLQNLYFALTGEELELKVDALQ